MAAARGGGTAAARGDGATTTHGRERAEGALLGRVRAEVGQQARGEGVAVHGSRTALMPVQIVVERILFELWRGEHRKIYEGSDGSAGYQRCGGFHTRGYHDGGEAACGQHLSVHPATARGNHHHHMKRNQRRRRRRANCAPNPTSFQLINLALWRFSAQRGGRAPMRLALLVAKMAATECLRMRRLAILPERPSRCFPSSRSTV